MFYNQIHEISKILLYTNAVDFLYAFEVVSIECW